MNTSDSGDVPWVFRLFTTLAGYGLIILLGRCLIRWVQREAERNDYLRSNFLFRFLRLFALGRPDIRLTISTASSQSGRCSQPEMDKMITENGQKSEVETRVGRNRPRKRSFWLDFVWMSIYFMGIQITLVCMGFFQERIVTRGYRLANIYQSQQQIDFFKDTQFLVLANRLVALFLSGTYLMITWKRQPVHVQPLYLHSFTSFSNVISSWCQYEALKYVSFPIQTVCKASKIVPTMLMGKVLRRQRYSSGQYTLALILVLGASIFFLSMPSSSSRPSTDHSTPNSTKEIGSDNLGFWIFDVLQPHSGTLSGLLLMCGYLFCDAFTPNWQKKLFDQPPRVSCSQMMFAVNMFSVLLCLLTLLQQWTLLLSIQFMLTHESFFTDCLLLSLGSACGQVFIYMTIQHFGPVALALMMTLRQIFSIFLSSFYFVHPINPQGFIGLLLVFGAIFVDIYSKYHKRGKRMERNG